MNNQTFKVGDKVTWYGDPEEPLDSVHRYLVNTYGEGPFVISYVYEVPEGMMSCGHYPNDPMHICCNDDPKWGLSQSMRGSVGHTQQVKIKGHTNWISGAWFTKANTNKA